jgi:hypothetical protein
MCLNQKVTVFGYSEAYGIILVNLDADSLNSVLMIPEALDARIKLMPTEYGTGVNVKVKREMIHKEQTRAG